MVKSNNLKSRKEYSQLFVYLAIIFVVCLLFSNILASKLLKIGKYSVTSGVLIFPVSFIVNDILSEIYGYEKTRKVIFFGFIMNIFMVAIFTIAIFLPAPTFYANNQAFKTILGATPRNCIAGLMAYLLGSLVNSKILVKMKGQNNNKFGIRAIISTIFGELTDSLIFVFIAFIGNLSFSQILSMIIIQVIIKTLYEIVLLPLTSFLVKKIENYEKVEG